MTITMPVTQIKVNDVQIFTNNVAIVECITIICLTNVIG